MSTAATAVVSALLGAQSSAIVYLAYGLSRMRERLARVEQRVEDSVHH